MDDDRTGRHRRLNEPLTPKPEPPREAYVEPVLIRAGVARHIDSLRATMLFVNASAAIACFLNAAGASPAFLFLASFWALPYWGVGFAAVAVGLAGTALGVNTRSVEHALAAALWGTTAAGGVIGLVTGTTTSRTASVVLSALIVGTAAHHVLALLFRRRMDRLSRPQERRQGG